MNTIVGLIISFFMLLPPMLNSYIDNELYEMQVQQLIEKGYLNTDYTTEELSNLCNTSYNDFEEDYTEACFWFL